MKHIYASWAVALLRAAGHSLSDAVRHVADAAYLAWWAVRTSDEDPGPVEEQPEWRINTWHEPGKEPRA